MGGGGRCTQRGKLGAGQPMDSRGAPCWLSQARANVCRSAHAGVRPASLPVRPLVCRASLGVFPGAEG